MTVSVYICFALLGLVSVKNFHRKSGVICNRRHYKYLMGCQRVLKIGDFGCLYYTDPCQMVRILRHNIYRIDPVN